MIWFDRFHGAIDYLRASARLDAHPQALPACGFHDEGRWWLLAGPADDRSRPFIHD